MDGFSTSSQLASEHGEKLIECGMLDEDSTDILATFCSLIPSKNQVIAATTPVIPHLPGEREISQSFD